MKQVRYVLCLLLLLFLYPAPLASAKSFSIDEVVIHAYVLDNGDLYVEELYTYNFSGDYNGTTRRIGDENHGGVQYFEGYLAPMDTDLANYDHTTFKPLKVEREDLTFKIHTPSENEKKKVFYRYQINGAAQKYRDTGQLYWRFFDDMNETDLHNLSIRLVLSGNRDATLAGRAYLHSFTGELTKSTDKGFVYNTDLLEAYEKLEIRFLFPETFLQNVPYKENKAMLAEFEAEEAAYEKWIMKRERALPTVELINFFVLGFILLLFVFVVLYPRRIYRLLLSKPPSHQLQEMDSFLLAMIESNGRVEPSAISAALLRLKQKGIVAMEKVPANAIYISDDNAPNYTFQFTVLKEHSTLNDFEKDLIDWLFEEDSEGKLQFSLDQFPFLSKQQRAKNWQLENDYSNRIKVFSKRFKQWKQIVRNDKEVKKYLVPNFIRKWLTFIGVPLWITWASLNFGMTSADPYDVIVLLLLLIGGFIALLINHSRRAALPIYFVFGFFWLVGNTSDFYMLFVFGTLLLFLSVLLLPMTDLTREAAPYYKGAKAFKKDVKSGKFDFQSDRNKIKWYEHAIALSLYIPILIHYKKNIPDNLASLPPLSAYLTELLRSFHYTHGYYYTYLRSSGSGGSSSSSSGSGGGGGAGAF